jgi:hypothetical protein
MDRTAENRQRSRHTPLVLPLLDLEVLSTDVDGVGSLMEGVCNHTYVYVVVYGWQSPLRRLAFWWATWR